jgi:hypothetical protein
MNGSRLIIAGVLLAVLATGAPALEFQNYHEFRYMSGLPGGGFGVTPDGLVGWEGALQMNVPIGYTPAQGNIALAAHSSAVNGGLEIGFEGHDINGTITFGVGVGPRRYPVWFSNMMTAKRGESAYNVQVQLRPEDEKWPAISVGVVDLSNRRASSIARIFEGEARSFFVVATREAGTPENPLYLTLGYGNKCFNDRFFGGASYTFNDRLKLLLEYDGWCVNGGVAYDLAQFGDDWRAVLLVGAVKMERFTTGISITRRSETGFGF